MRRNLLLSTASAAAVVLGFVAAAAPAKANGLDNVFGDNWYVTVFGGGAFTSGHGDYYGDIYEIQLKDGFTVGGVIGTHVAPGVRFEREVSYVENDHDETRADADDDYFDLSGDTSTIFLLANLWKDFHMGPLSPYVGAGVGTAFINSEGDFDNGGTDTGWDDRAIAFAAQIGAGVRFGLTDRLAVDAGYRFKAAIDASFDGDDDFNDENGAFTFYSHIAQVGLTYAMGSDAQVMPAADIVSDEPSWYVSLFGGVVFPDNTAFHTGTVYSVENKTGFTVGAAAGTYLSPTLRGELEASYLRHALDSYTDSGDDEEDPADGHLEQIYVLANLWKDFHLGPLSPYVGAGIGVGILNFDDGELDGTINGDSALGLAGQFGGGVRFSMFDSLAFDLGYRFKSIVNAMVEGDADEDYDDNANVATYNHIVQLGVTYGFGGGMYAEPAADLAPMEDTTWYASLFGGISIPVDTNIAYASYGYMVDFKNGFTVGAAVGTHVMETVRGDLEVSYVSYDADESDSEGVDFDAEGDVDIVFLLANVWKDFDLGIFAPYAGFGVGMAFVDVDIDLTDDDQLINDSSVALAGQAGAGVRFGITDNLTADVGYRFKAALDVLTEGDSGTDSDHAQASYYSHNIQGGLSWAF